MKMIGFRVQNYKKIRDTDWISCENLTAFVGKNEAGKSALFRGLSKLNPSDGEKYDGLKEFPRKMYTSEFKKQDWPVSSVKFVLLDSEKSELSKSLPLLKNLEYIICTRYYSWNMDIEFVPTPILPNIKNSVLLDILTKILNEVQDLVAPDGKGDQFKTIKEKIINFINQQINLSKQKLDVNVSQQEINDLITKISSIINEQWQKDIFYHIIIKLRDFKNLIDVQSQVDNAKQWVENNIPKFIYFDSYNAIDSAIHIPSLINTIRDDPNNARIRSNKCLFDQVGINLNEIAKLDPSSIEKQQSILRKMADERAVQMSSASATMTDMFSDWWEQRRHKFRYQLDGQFFRIWVSDDFDPSEIELDQRSRGLQYFFSFYTIFLVEASGAHQNAILLLDEPGLYMHGSAQGKLVNFFEKLSENNQTLYSTHSPFMIDGKHLERVRVVYESDDGTTKVSEDVWPKDKDALFPLQAALGYSIAQTLFYSEKQLIVEGITDYTILWSINEKLKEKGLTHLFDDIIIIPAGGTSILIPLASMLMGHGIKIMALLDGDKAGRSKGKEFQDRLFTGNGRRCLFVGDSIDNSEAELEDLFPEDFYMDLVKEHYKFDISFTEDEKKIKNITKRLSKAFERLGYDKFEKWYIARLVINRINDEKNTLSEETFKNFSNIFNEVNNVFAEKTN
ncbi:hypothetical protein CUJ83_00755 [Methanocella sp. CWC-04]|uniref:AAA ATPase domain-containing protein n=1 Tax=Methanooceanicella nereidis TaxID=2052831 RepID=A0AAP2RBE4_9EURY|nr:AAA family ATPase [Methanocella sp. CWC-04]MCD1293525.1 hypothetical protein [Methanocella sp. CWC-04]